MSVCYNPLTNHNNNDNGNSYIHSVVVYINIYCLNYNQYNGYGFNIYQYMLVRVCNWILYYINVFVLKYFDGILIQML